MKAVMFAVCVEGNVNVSRIPDVHKGIITRQAYWATEDEAITSMNRRWHNFGTFRSKRVWVEKVTADSALRSDLSSGRPEYVVH